MTEIRFEWDQRKSRLNLRKHGVGFEDAVQVFFDPLRVIALDRVVDGEERWHALGYFEGILLLLVVHTISEECDEGKYVEVVRIISAREATPSERRAYEDENG